VHGTDLVVRQRSWMRGLCAVTGGREMEIKYINGGQFVALFETGYIRESERALQGNLRIIVILWTVDEGEYLSDHQI
jgi:hypothetical protein